MERRPHENVATVLVDPAVLAELEFHLMSLDLWVWPVATAPICTDGPRRAFQIRHRMLISRRGAWDHASTWTPVWISFGPSWRNGDEPLPWEAHRTLWNTLRGYDPAVLFRRGLGGVPKLAAPHEEAS